MQHKQTRKHSPKAPTYEQFMAALAATQEAFEKRLLALEALEQKRVAAELAAAEARILAEQEAEQKRILAEQEAEQNRILAEKEAQKAQKEAERERKKIARERKEAERARKEAEMERKEAEKKFDRQIAELNKQMGYVSNRMGEVIEALAGRAIYKQLAKLGHKIRSFEEGVKLRGKDFQVVAEVDAVLYNAHTVFLAEVKTKITSQHIDQHIRCIETVRSLSTDIHPEMPIAGIVAAVVFPDAVATYAMKKGLIVVRPENELFAIINPPGFEVKFW